MGRQILYNSWQWLHVWTQIKRFQPLTSPAIKNQPNDVHENEYATSLNAQKCVTQHPPSTKQLSYQVVRNHGIIIT